MRDPNRIDKFCATLAELWHKVPDWRFGQLIRNMLQNNILQALFYMEDDTMLIEMKNYFKENEDE